MVLAALSTLLQFAAEDDAELGYLTAQIAAGGATGAFRRIGCDTC